MLTHRELFRVAWPYTLSMSTAFLVQLINNAMLAPSGTVALAAMGVAISSCFLPNAFTMGLITSVQKRTALANSHEEICRSLTSGLLQALALASPFAIVFGLFSHQIASLFTSGPALEEAANYLMIFSPSFVLGSVNQAITGYWIGSLNSRTRLYVTLATTLIVALLDLALIPRYGVAGASIASVLAITGGFIINFYLLKKFHNFHFIRPKMDEMKKDLRIIFGVSLHQLSLALTINVSTLIVGLMGVDALAIANVIGTLSLPALYLGIGYGTASSSYLVKCLENHGNREAKAVGRISLSQVFVTGLFLAFGLTLFSTYLRTFFFHEPHVFAESSGPFALLAFLFIVDSLCCALQRFHFVADGLKKSFYLMSIVQWIFFLPVAWIGVKYFGLQYTGFIVLHVGQRFIIAILLYWLWQTRLRRKEIGPAFEQARLTAKPAM